jgi:hypothetical protein
MKKRTFSVIRANRSAPVLAASLSFLDRIWNSGRSLFGLLAFFDSPSLLSSRLFDFYREKKHPFFFSNADAWQPSLRRRAAPTRALFAPELQMT